MAVKTPPRRKSLTSNEATVYEPTEIQATSSENRDLVQIKETDSALVLSDTDDSSPLPESIDREYAQRHYPEKETISGGIWNYVYDNMDLSDDDKKLLSFIEERLKRAGADPERAAEFMAWFQVSLEIFARGLPLPSLPSPSDSSLPEIGVASSQLEVEEGPTSRQFQEQAKQLPQLPSGLAWPELKYENAPERGKGKKAAIIKFLRRPEWQRLFDGGAVVTRQILKQVDFKAWEALEGFLRYSDLPSDIPILTDDDLAKRVKLGTLVVQPADQLKCG